MQYRRRDSMARLYDLNIRFVDTLAKEMEKSGRYPGDSVLRGKGYVLIEEDAFRDYLHVREMLRDPVVRAFVEEYQRPVEKAEEIYVLGGTQ